jgi:hypothetical protein
MENNQEHKIDKIFKKSLENQLIAPPSDAWTAVHTYTIGQEESKKKVWVRYASSALVLLFISGLGVWYFVDNQGTINNKLVSKNTSQIPSSDKEKSTVRTHRTASDNAVRQFHFGFNSASVTTPKQIIHLDNESSGLQISNAKKEIHLPKLLKQEKFAGLKTIEKEPLITEMVEDSLTNDNIEFIEPVSYFRANKMVKIESKSLIMNDLVDRIQNGNESKIVAFQEKIKTEKEVYKADSLVFGRGVSLKHPIITYGFGMIWNFWDIGDYKYYKVLFPNERGSNIQIGLAWNLNKKMRTGLTFASNGYNLGTVAISLPQSNSNIELSTIKLIKENQYYIEELPFGNALIPVSYFQNAPASFPNQLDTLRRILFSSHTMRTFTISANFKYDFISKMRGKTKHYSYQVYGLSDLAIQRQTSYSFTSQDYYSLSSSIEPINTTSIIFYNTDHLQNASEFVFGLRAGLGFRYQFGRKWDFFVEGSGQYSLNNWVNSDDIKTFQRTLSLQAGINLNL